MKSLEQREVPLNTAESYKWRGINPHLSSARVMQTATQFRETESVKQLEAANGTRHKSCGIYFKS